MPYQLRIEKIIIRRSLNWWNYQEILRHEEEPCFTPEYAWEAAIGTCQYLNIPSSLNVYQCSSPVTAGRMNKIQSLQTQHVIYPLCLQTQQLCSGPSHSSLYSGLLLGLVEGLTLWALSKETRVPVSCLEVITTSLLTLLLVTSEFQELPKRYYSQSSAPHPEIDHPNYRLDLERYTARVCWSLWYFHVPTEQKQGKISGHFQRREGNVFFIKSLMVGLIWEKLLFINLPWNSYVEIDH